MPGGNPVAGHLRFRPPGPGGTTRFHRGGPEHGKDECAENQPISSLRPPERPIECAGLFGRAGLRVSAVDLPDV